LSIPHSFSSFWSPYTSNKAHTQGQKYQQPHPPVKIISCPQILHEFPSRNDTIMVIVPSLS
jgi:hypothetical protein